MPENNVTAKGFKDRIMRERPDINQRFAERVAKRIKRRMDYMTQFVDVPAEAVYEQGLRILGIHSDITPRDAIANIEEENAA